MPDYESDASAERDTDYSGDLRDRYAVYAEQARQLGWPVKSFDEWLNS